MLEGLPKAIKARRLHWVAEPCSFKTTLEYAVVAKAANTPNSTALLLRAQSLDSYRDPWLTLALESLLHPLDHHQKTAKPQNLRAIEEGDLPASRLHIDADTSAVWVIIPVFDAPAALDRCLTSITAAKNKTNTRVLVVDDASPDPAVQAVLHQHSARFAIHVIRKHTNGGFSAAVNTGIAAVGGCDVIILNSDTVVTDHWVDKLRRCAYQSTEIAGACPLSNNAELLSVPTAMRPTPIPGTQTITAINEFLERQTPRPTPATLAAGVGFCWYLKASTIEKVGLFDDTLVELGYGEDTDYSVRISKAGLRTVAARDTFVGHEGSQSFKASKRALAAQNNRRLAHIHPEHFLIYEQWIRERGHESLGHALQIFLIKTGHMPSCTLYELPAWQWDYLTHVSCLPAIGMVASDDRTLQVCAHRIPALDRLTIKHPVEKKQITDALLTHLGAPRQPAYERPPGRKRICAGPTLKLNPSKNATHRVLVPYLKTPSSGFFEVVKRAQAISKHGLNLVFVIIGPTVCDRELARHPCVELAGNAKGEDLQRQAALLRCSTIFTAHDNPLVWEMELSDATGLPLLSDKEISAAIRIYAR